MDKSAIEQIQQSQSIQAANELIGQMPEHSKPVVALPSDFKLHDYESNMQSRYRFRGKYVTHSLSAFASYVKPRQESAASAVFIDADDMRAKLILNLGNEQSPGHCDNIALIQLQKTAAYTALLEIAGKQQQQRTISEFIEDWRTNLTAQSEENENGEIDEISIVKALHAVRSITIEAKKNVESETRTFGQTTSGMESIDAKSKHTLPAMLTFTCKPYHELAERTFVLRLSVITGNTPLLVLRIVHEQEHQEQMAKEFEALITQKIGGGVPAYIGTFSA